MANVTPIIGVNGSVTTSDTTYVVNVSRILLLRNTHASQTLTVNFGAATDSASLVLAAGEQIENLDISFGTLYTKGSGASTTFKFLGEVGFSS